MLLNTVKGEEKEEPIKMKLVRENDKEQASKRKIFILRRKTVLS